MSKNLILQVSIAKKGNEGQGFLKYDKNIYDHSIESAKEYADRIGADHYVIRSEDFIGTGYHPTWYRFSLFTDQFDKWDNIVYCDADFFFHQQTPDIFQMMDENEEWVFASPDTSGEQFKFRHRFGGRYFNAGLFCIKRPAIELVKPFWREYIDGFLDHQFLDQDALNSLVADHFDNPEDRKFKLISKHWNGTFASLKWLFCAHYAAIAKRDWDYEAHAKKIEKRRRQLECMSDTEKRQLYYYYPSKWKTPQLF